MLFIKTAALPLLNKTLLTPSSRNRRDSGYYHRPAGRSLRSLLAHATVGLPPARNLLPDTFQQDGQSGLLFYCQYFQVHAQPDFQLQYLKIV
jgi:hypothetical protein